MSAREGDYPTPFPIPALRPVDEGDHEHVPVCVRFRYGDVWMCDDCGDVLDGLDSCRSRTDG